MVFRTQSGRKYVYDPSTNRLSNYGGKDFICLPVSYRSSSEYDFSRIGMYTIEVTQQCNLRCTYCCYSGEYVDRRRHNESEISYEDLGRCVEFIKKHTPPDIPVVYVSFYGGEALLSIDKIKWTISRLVSECPQYEFEFSISTNGLLISDAVREWIARSSNIYLTITIDGDRMVHDKNRVTENGQGSFDIIINNLNQFKERYPDLFNNRIRFISTVRSISDLPRLNDFWMGNDLLKDNRPQHISSIIPNFDKGEKISVDREKFERTYSLAMDYHRKGVENILTDELENLVKTVRRRNYSELSDPQALITCINSPSTCFITSRGDLYVCERLCGRLKIGNLERDIDRNLCDAINNGYTERKNRYCSTCWSRRLCRRCPVGMNFSEDQFQRYCLNEKMQLELALKYYCELLEFKHNLKSIN